MTTGDYICGFEKNHSFGKWKKIKRHEEFENEIV